ncbi:MAG: DNA cytosine methyltransferase [Gemmiger sp.]
MVKENTKTGYQLAYPGDSISLAYATTNTHRGRVGHGIAHTLTTSPNQGVLCFVDMNENPDCTSLSRCLTPRECLRLQGWTDDRIDKILAVQSDNQPYKRAGNGVTVNVVEAIGRRLAAVDAELRGGKVSAP